MSLCVLRGMPPRPSLSAHIRPLHCRRKPRVTAHWYCCRSLTSPLQLLIGFRSLSETRSESPTRCSSARARWRSVMTTVGETGLDTKGFRLADKVWHRARLHLTHDLSTMNLDRDFAQVHLRGNLLV